MNITERLFSYLTKTSLGILSAAILFYFADALLFTRATITTTMAAENLTMHKKLFYTFIFLGMGINGFLYLGWFLSPPNPDRIGYWFLIYLFVFPYLGILGIIALLLKSVLNIPSSIGIALLLYVGVLTIVANSFHLGLTWMLAWLPELGYEFLHLILFALTLMWLIFLVQR